MQSHDYVAIALLVTNFITNILTLISSRQNNSAINEGANLVIKK